MSKDTTKTPFGLIPLEALAGLARVIRHGNEKHQGRDSWKTAELPMSEYVSALLRHLDAWQRGENYDQSGEHHLDHVLCNAMILSWLAQHGEPAIDDRTYEGWAPPGDQGPTDYAPYDPHACPAFDATHPCAFDKRGGQVRCRYCANIDPLSTMDLQPLPYSG